MLRGRWLLWIVTALAVCSAATAVAAVARVRPGDDPSSVIHRYFAALARGDAAGALSWSERPVTGRYLSAGVLRQQRQLAPISQVRIRSVRAVDSGHKQAIVSYRLGFAGGASVSTDTVELSAHGHGWRLHQVAAEVRISSSAPGWLTLAGAVLPPSALLFPGALPVLPGWSGLSVTNRPVVLLRTGSVTAEAAVNPAGRALVQAGLRAALSACLTSPAPRCPLPAGVRAVPGSLRGQISDLGSADVHFAAGGVLQMHARATVRGRYSVWDFDNIAQPRAATLQLALSAQCSAADLRTMYWQP